MKKQGMESMESSTKKLGLDLGNSSMKVVGGEGDTLIYKRARSLATTNSDDTSQVVDIDGEVVYFGVGTSLIEHDKTDRKYLAHSILLAVYEVYGPGEHQVALGVTLPIDLYKLMKDTFRKKVEELKKISGKVNGKAIDITIKSISIDAEGLIAFYALMPEIPKGPILFIDMGHGTTDVIAANVDMETKKWRIEGSQSFHFGGFNLLTELRGPLYAETKTFFTVTEIEQYIANGGKIGRTQINSLYKAALSAKVNEMFKDINQVFHDMSFREIYICGGCAPMLEACLEEDNIHIIPDQKMVYSNAVGSYLKIKSL